MSFMKSVPEINKKYYYYTMASIAIVFVFLTAIELTTRLASWLGGSGFSLRLDELDPYDKRTESIYQWHPFIGFTFKPNTSFIGSHPYSSDIAKLLVDRHGFLARDNLLEIDKPENAIRIATIGASTTASVNLAFDMNWPGRLGTLLEERLPGRTIRVINAAIPGCDTAQSIGNLALRVMPFKPDVVIIYHAYNDLKAIRPDREFLADYSHIHRTPYGFHKKPPLFVLWLNHSMAYVRIRNKYREINKRERHVPKIKNEKRLSNVPDEAKLAFEEHVRTLVGIARAGGAKVVLSSFATLHDPELDYDDVTMTAELTRLKQVELRSLLHFTPGLTLKGIFSGIREYNATLYKVAISEETGWTDNARLVPHEDGYFLDRAHFSRRGTNRMAENFLPAFIKALHK